MRRQLPAIVTLAVAVATLGAQQPPAQPAPAQPPVAQPAPAQTPAPQPPPGQQPPVFKAGTNQVRVDVSVVDRKGEPVTDLTKEDFDVREDGVAQTIDTIKLIEATGAAPDDDMSLRIRSPEH